MTDLAQLRRWQADEYEKKSQPRPGELNIPQILRDDADEIERLNKRHDCFLEEFWATNAEINRLRSALELAKDHLVGEAWLAADLALAGETDDGG